MTPIQIAGNLICLIGMVVGLIGLYQNSKARPGDHFAGHKCMWSGFVLLIIGAALR